MTLIWETLRGNKMIGKLLVAPALATTLALGTALLADPAAAKPPFKFGHHAFVDGDVIILQCVFGVPAENNIYKLASDHRSDGAGTPIDVPNATDPIPCAQVLSDLILEGFAIDETLGDDSSHYYRLIR